MLAITESADFKRLVADGHFYVDKTLFIKDLLEQEKFMSLFTRPRRFGKTMNQRMLRAFFDRKEDNRHLFEGLAIGKFPQLLDAHCNQYPVIFLSFNALEKTSFEGFQEAVRHAVSEFYCEHQEILPHLSEIDSAYFNDVVNQTLKWESYDRALDKLQGFLYKHYQKKVVILIDEYDVPIQKAFYQNTAENKYFEQVLNFFRVFYVTALKNNEEQVQLAVLTGCLRISKESLFTGMNNLNVYSVLTPMFGQYFGFTQSEVEDSLAKFGVLERFPEVQAWYDGYVFDKFEIYNPWSVSKFLQFKHEEPSAYWVNTASDSILKDLFSRVENDELRKEIERLKDGQPIEKRLMENIHFQQLHTDENMIFSFLVASGYLKAKKIKNKNTFLLQIPNQEVHTAYESLTYELLNGFLSTGNAKALMEAIMSEQPRQFEVILNNALLKTSSFDIARTYEENSYHMYLLGLLFQYNDKYTVLSNRKSGYGRYDICVMERSSKKAVILELKRALDDTDQLLQLCEEALAQATIKAYEADLLAHGYDDIKIYGIGFKGKVCKVMLQG